MNENTNIIYLTGFMASGKSTLGPILANTIGWDFCDLDKLIEQKEGIKIRDIFSVKGDSYFRNLEQEVLSEISQRIKIVISLGGGTIASKENLSIIKAKGIVIYLKASPEAAYKRLRFKRDRPSLLFDGDDEPSKEEYLERINNLLEERIHYYEQADITIDSESGSIGKTVDVIIRKLSNMIRL